MHLKKKYIFLPPYFFKKGHSKLSKNGPENIPWTGKVELVKSPLWYLFEQKKVGWSDYGSRGLCEGGGTVKNKKVVEEKRAVEKQRF